MIFPLFSPQTKHDGTTKLLRPQWHSAIVFLWCYYVEGINILLLYYYYYSFHLKFELVVRNLQRGEFVTRSGGRTTVEPIDIGPDDCLCRLGTLTHVRVVHYQ